MVFHNIIEMREESGDIHEILLLRLPRLLGTFSIEAIYAIAPNELKNKDTFKKSLAILRRWKLINYNPETRRFSLPEQVRDSLTIPDDEDIFNDYADFYIKRAEIIFELPTEEWRNHADDIDNIIVVGDKLAIETEGGTTGDITRALEFAIHCIDYVVNHHENKLHWLEMGLNGIQNQRQVIPDNKSLLRIESHLLIQIGMVWDKLGDKQQAITFYNQALLLKQAVDDKVGEASMLSNIGLAWSALGNYQQALNFHNQTLPLLQTAGDIYGQFVCYGNIALVHHDLDQLDLAIEYMQEAVAIGEQINHSSLILYQNFLQKWLYKQREIEAIQLYERGNQLYKDGSMSLALESLKQALELSKKADNKHFEIVIRNYIGNIYESQKNHEWALGYFEEALKIAREVEDITQEISGLMNIGHSLLIQNELSTALEFQTEALILSRSMKDRLIEATCLDNIGTIWAEFENYEKAYQYYEKAYRIREEENDVNGLIITSHNLYYNYYATGNLKLAIKYLQQCISLEEAVNHPDLERDRQFLARIKHEYQQEADNLLYGADNALSKQDYTIATIYLNHASNIYKELDNKQSLAIVFMKIATIRRTTKEFEQALDFFNQALSLFRAVGDKTLEAGMLNNIGMVWNDLGNKQQALHFYNQALILAQVIDDKSGKAITLGNIAKVWDDLGDKQQALHFYNQALSLFQLTADKSSEATMLYNIGTIRAEIGNQQQALHFYNQALPLLREIGNKSGEATTLNNIGGVWDALGDKQQAIDFYNQALPVFQAAGAIYNQCTCYGNIAFTYHDLDQLEPAIEAIQEAVTIGTRINHPRLSIYQDFLQQLLDKQNGGS